MNAGFTPEKEPLRDVAEVSFTHAGVQVTVDTSDSDLLLVDVLVQGEHRLVVTLTPGDAVVSVLPGYKAHLLQADEKGPRRLVASAAAEEFVVAEEPASTPVDGVIVPNALSWLLLRSRDEFSHDELNHLAEEETLTPEERRWLFSLHRRRRGKRA